MFDVFHYEETSREEIMRKYFIKPSNVKTGEAGESATLVGYENTPMFRLDELRVSGSPHRSRPAVVQRPLRARRTRKLRGGRTRKYRLEKTAQFFVPAGAGDMTLSAGPGSPLRILRFRGPRA